MFSKKQQIIRKLVDFICKFEAQNTAIMSDTYLDQLNTIQRQAVMTTDGPVMVIAGPGSGKTRVLTFRVAHLIEKGVKPWNILALTFTNKAAKEMKERINNTIGGGVATSVWAGTFHSIFARILRAEAELIGYPSNFTIYDTQDSKSVLSNIIRENNLEPKVYAVNAIRARIASCKYNLISPKAYIENNELIQEDYQRKQPHFQKIYKSYMARCRRAGAMDFDDLMYQMFILLHKNPNNVIKKYHDKFKYLMVDEFQDTNFLQYQIVRKLVNYPGSPHNVCIVGDDAQSIYAFRGATIENILNFQKDYKQANIFKLEQNYRSTHHIVQAANEVIMNNQRQIQKKIWTEKGKGEPIKVLQTVTDSEEGKRVADLILEQKTRYHLQNKDIAILYRTNAQSRSFEESLRSLRISYRVYGGLSFYQRKEIKDMLGYLRLIVNPNDEEALRRVINFPKRAIGKSTIDKISAWADAENQPMWSVVENIDKFKLSARAMNAIKGFVKLIKKLQKQQDTKDAYELAKIAATESGLLKMLGEDKTIEGMNRMENVQGLLDGIKIFVDAEPVEDEDKKLATYLQSISLLTDQDKEDDSDDKVTLMSIHAAKGLEFPSVFVVGLEEDLFPSFMSKNTVDEMDEERRLFYVAITRAELHLTLSYSKSRYRFGQIRYNDKSRFLDEISNENLHVSIPFNKSLSNGRSGVSGASKYGTMTPKLRKAPAASSDPSFKATKATDLNIGQEIEHFRFGKGAIQSIEGAKGNEVVTVKFKGVGEKRIMLKFAKLKI